MSNKNSKQFCPSNFDILYQDQWIVVINKPEGLLSVPYPGCSQKTAINILEEIMRKKGLANSKHHPFAVHRLDRDTSGVMMFALSKSIQQKIMNNWQKMVTERLYRCLSEITKNADPKILENHDGVISDELAKNAHHIGYVPKNNDKTKQVNFTIAIYICREYLRNKRNLSPPDVIKLIEKHILPVRPGRKDPRKVKPQASVSFLYRVA